MANCSLHARPERERKRKEKLRAGMFTEQIIGEYKKRNFETHD